MGDETLTRVSRGTGRRLVAVIPLKGRREGREGGVKGQAQMPDLKSGKRGGVSFVSGRSGHPRRVTHMLPALLAPAREKRSNTENYAGTTSPHSQLGHLRDGKRWFCGVLTVGVAS